MKVKHKVKNLFKKKEKPKYMNSQELQDFLQTQPEETRKNMQDLIDHMIDIYNRAYQKGYNDFYKVNMTIWMVTLGAIAIISIIKGHLI